jgi:toxin ParE1/3/4
LKRYEVHFLAEAITDLDAHFCYIADESSYEIADGYLTRIERLCRSLESFPQRGTAVAGSATGLRTMGFERRATILFCVGEDKVEILRVYYGGQELGPEVKRLLGV